jgi:hypothetical protein
MLGNVLFFFPSLKSAHGIDSELGAQLICTPDGLQGTIPEPGQQSDPHCPNCTLVKSFVFALASVPSEYLPPTQNVLHVAWSPIRNAVSPLMLGGIGSRAPPAFT